MLIDSHCHLHDEEWFSPAQAEECLKHASANGVEKIICIGTDPGDSKNAHKFAAAHENVYWTYGIHPEFTEQLKLQQGSRLPFFEGIRSYGEEERDDPATAGVIDAPREKSVASSPADAPIAIGEIGLDYHYDGYDRDAQIAVFEQMLQLAQDSHLPVSLHIREAFLDAFAVLDNFPGLTGVVHSFTGNKRELKQALERGFYVGVNGLATYTTINLPPLERMLLETDAPFLTPVPNRGTMNMPGYVRDIASYLAANLGVEEKLIAERTTKNAQRLFHI